MQLTKDNCSLFFVIENKEQLIMETKKSIYHIIESDSWIKDITIYLVTPTSIKLNNNIKQDFLSIYNNIFFIEEECVKYSDHVFFNMIYGCSLAERKINTDYLIYLDCDMYLINDFPTYFKGELVLESEGYYNQESDNWLKTKNKWLKILKQDITNFTYINTEFMITKKDNNIFQQWENTFNNLYPDLKKFERTYKKIYKDIGFDISCMEETSFELLINDLELDILFLPDVVARLADPSAIPDNTNNILFLSQHIKKTNDIIFDYSDNSFKADTVTMELIYSCEFDCFFCEKPNLDKPIILELNKFKYYLDKLTSQGITCIDLTPTKGDILNIPNITEYLKIVEEDEKVTKYYFYTSLAIKDKLDHNLINFINKSKKLHVYFSCYFDNDFNSFNKIVRKDKEVYIKNKKDSLNFIKDICKYKITFIDRVNKYSLKYLYKNNQVAKLAKLKGIEVITEEDDLKEKRDKFLRDTGFCEQFLCCSTLKMNGEFVYCNYGKSYYDGVVENIENFTNKNLLTYELINSDLCRKCMYKMESGIKERIWNPELYIKNYKKETSM